MPSGMAAEMRAALPSIDRTGLVLQRSTKSLTGFVNVIEVKGKFQARLQVPGDGRGGEKKRKQVPLPGVFDTAEDAAVYLASFKKGLEEAGMSAAQAAEKIEPQDKKHKPRTPKQPAAARLQSERSWSRYRRSRESPAPAAETAVTTAHATSPSQPLARHLHTYDYWH